MDKTNKELSDLLMYWASAYNSIYLTPHTREILKECAKRLHNIDELYIKRPKCLEQTCKERSNFEKDMI